MPPWFGILKVSDDDTRKERDDKYKERRAKKRFPNYTESYHVSANVWTLAGLEYNDGTPTILELEELLGRKLVKEDFLLESPLNWGGAYKHPNVLDRITREGVIEGLRSSAETPYGWFSRDAPLISLNNRKRRLKYFAERNGITLDFTNWDNRVEIMSHRREDEQNAI